MLSELAVRPVITLKIDTNSEVFWNYQPYTPTPKMDHLRRVRINSTPQMFQKLLAHGRHINLKQSLNERFDEHGETKSAICCDDKVCSLFE